MYYREKGIILQDMKIKYYQMFMDLKNEIESNWK